MSTTKETKIDWSKPVQTKETPPRKVRILTTEVRSDYPVMGNIERDDITQCWTFDGNYSRVGKSNLDLENTPQQPEQWAAEKAAFAAGETIQYKWDHQNEWNDVEKPLWSKYDDLKYRIKPKQQKVQLGPCDVPPGSVIRCGGNHWFMVVYCCHEGVKVSGRQGVISWEELKLCWKIKRPTDTEFQPCWKLIDPK